MLCGFFTCLVNPTPRDPRDPKAEEEEESPPPIFLPSAVPYSFRSGAEEEEGEEEEEEEEDGGDDVSRLEGLTRVRTDGGVKVERFPVGSLLLLLLLLLPLTRAPDAFSPAYALRASRHEDGGRRMGGASRSRLLSCCWGIFRLLLL